MGFHEQAVIWALSVGNLTKGPKKTKNLTMTDSPMIQNAMDSRWLIRIAARIWVRYSLTAWPARTAYWFSC